MPFPFASMPVWYRSRMNLRSMSATMPSMVIRIGPAASVVERRQNGDARHKLARLEGVRDRPRHMGSALGLVKQTRVEHGRHDAQEQAGRPGQPR
jgi:hypothetical protein